jgi:hypothetical protein
VVLGVSPPTLRAARGVCSEPVRALSKVNLEDVLCVNLKGELQVNSGRGLPSAKTPARGGTGGRFKTGAARKAGDSRFFSRRKLGALVAAVAPAVDLLPVQTRRRAVGAVPGFDG